MSLKSKLNNWVVQEISTTLEGVYGSQLADDVAEALRSYLMTTRSDQMAIRMAREIRNQQTRGLAPEWTDGNVMGSNKLDDQEVL